jgi:GDPmannose 4,6-dehydratase
VQIAFDYVGLDWRSHVVVDPQFYRPAEVDILLANPKKAQERLGWKREVSFTQLVTRMVDADLNLLGNGLAGPHRPAQFKHRAA